MSAMLTISRPAYSVKNQPAKDPAEKSDGLGRILGGMVTTSDVIGRASATFDF